MGEIVRANWTGKGSGGNTTGNPPGDNELLKRVERLEEGMTELKVRLVRIETRLEQTATKSDIQELAVGFHKSMTEQTWKFLGGATGIAGLLSAIAFSLAKLV